MIGKQIFEKNFYQKVFINYEYLVTVSKMNK